MSGTENINQRSEIYPLREGLDTRVNRHKLTTLSFLLGWRQINSALITPTLSKKLLVCSSTSCACFSWHQNAWTVHSQLWAQLKSVVWVRVKMPLDSSSGSSESEHSCECKLTSNWDKFHINTAVNMDNIRTCDALPCEETSHSVLPADRSTCVLPSSFPKKFVEFFKKQHLQLFKACWPTGTTCDTTLGSPEPEGRTGHCRSEPRLKGLQRRLPIPPSRQRWVKHTNRWHLV